MCMDTTNLFMAEAGVLLRAAIVGLVGYAGYSLFSGSTFAVTTYTAIVLVLFALTNVAFFVLDYFKPELVDVSEMVREKVDE